jgi:uncharacterized protein with FMN-binding domain
MKKLLLSLTVIVSFIFYSIYKQNNSSFLASSASPITLPPINIPPTSIPGSQYKDGVYTGSTEDVFYGNVQVQAIIQNGKISDVKFLQSPNDRRTSIEINSQAMPMLKSEAIQTQNANVDGVSGATSTSQGFVASLGSALAKAK